MGMGTLSSSPSASSHLGWRHWPLRQPLAFVLLAAAVWWGLYQTLVPASEWLVAQMPVERNSHLGGALAALS